MNQLAGIPIKTIPATRQSEPQPIGAGNALPILHELATMLERLIETGETDAIDLHRAPLRPGDYEVLKAVLGKGEVSASLEALGVTEIQETAVPGVWWITHYNQEGQRLTELIEVTEVPAILKIHPDDLETGPAFLRNRLS